MNSGYFFTPELLCNSSFTVGITPEEENQNRMEVGPPPPVRNTPISTSSFMVRMAMKISRAKWFSFLRRVFHYQNGLRSEMGSNNPFNSGAWMMAELSVLVLQMGMIVYTLAVSETETPVWPMRIWVSGYGFGCVFSLVLLCWRYLVFVLLPLRGVPSGSSTLPDIERQSSNDHESRILLRMNTYRSFLELFFGIWFVVGNIWMFDSRFFSFRRAPKLYILCISLLSWNAISYSFPFILFLILCCIVPLVSTLLGYNMNMGSIDRGALDEHISKLPSWKYVNPPESKHSSLNNDEKPECCICLAKYKEKEELRQLPCNHVFHLKCVDQWLKIISCCPLCKKDLQR